MVPGEIIIKNDTISINVGRPTRTLKVTNSGDRPVQVGSHFHFFETNKFLKFDRAQAFGYRLDIAAGTSVRFEPGETKEIQVVEFGGSKRLVGFNNLADTQCNDLTLAASMEKARQKGFI
jgi:urease subunit gamma/beta